MPQPFLYLHMAAIDPLGCRIPDILSQTDLVEGKDYMFSVGDENGQVDIETLNKIFNSINVFLSTALGGGWELNVTTSMATKTLCIVPNHTSMKEIANDGQRAFVLEEFLPISMVNDNVIRKMCHYEEVAENIIKAANDQYKRPVFIEETDSQIVVDYAYKWVTSITWEVVCKEWIQHFKQTFGL